MSTRALVIAVVVLGVLIGAVVIVPMLTSGNSAPDSAAPTVLIDTIEPPAVRQLLVRRIDDGTAVEVERTASGRWVYGDAHTRSWPASRTEAAMAALTQLMRSPADDVSAGIPANNWTFALELSDAQGNTKVVSVAGEALGGRRRVQTDDSPPRFAHIDEHVFAMLVDPGPASWRVRSPLHGVRDASRLTLRTSEGEIALARLGSRWSLRAPVSARADLRAVESLHSALIGLRVKRFLDAGHLSADAAGLSQPRLIISVERDRRTADEAGNVHTDIERQVLRIGGSASTDGDVLFAALGIDGDASCVIDAAQVASISTAVRNYLAPTVSAIEPADVMSIVIRDANGTGELRWDRTAGGWKYEGNSAPHTGEEAEELLQFVTTQPGEADVVGDDGAIRIVQNVELLDLAGHPLDQFACGVTAVGNVGCVSRGVVVVFDGNLAPAALQLPAQ